MGSLSFDFSEFFLVCGNLLVQHSLQEPPVPSKITHNWVIHCGLAKVGGFSHSLTVGVFGKYL